MLSKSYPVVEIFKSIEGEGIRTGYPTIFVRFAGCNLRCSWCDTDYSHKAEDGNLQTTTQILEQIFNLGCKRVTFTGGEPLISGGEFIKFFQKNYGGLFDINIETNGSVDISEFAQYSTMFTLDYKCPSSGVESEMLTENFSYLQDGDVIKFVVANDEDLETVGSVLLTHTPNCDHIFISPVFGQMDLQKLADFVVKHDFLKVRMGLQIHKFIWDPLTRGV